MPLQATSGAASYDAFGGGVAAVPNYIEDVFSTWLYTGNGSTQTITNGVDLSGKGGLVWGKNRSANWDHYLADTAQGVGKFLSSNTTSATQLDSTSVTAFNSNGFSIGNAGSSFNDSGNNYASWTFREAPKFFDVVTYTGNGTSQNIAHSLGSVPGCIIVKDISNTRAWSVYHTSLGNTQNLILSGTNAAATATDWNNTTPTSTVFTVGNNVRTNASGATYVAYLFAHNAGGFGLTGTDNVISCGSWTTNTDVNLGYEPQWILYRNAGTIDNWKIVDNMRGFSNTDGTFTAQAVLNPNTSGAEGSASGVFPTATGFTTGLGSGTFIYIAIRRGPMKTPTTGTSVFSPNVFAGAAGTQINTGFPVDMQFLFPRDGGFSLKVLDRLRGVNSTNGTLSTPWLATANTAAEANGANTLGWNNTGFQMTTDWQFNLISFNNFRRAPGFFDEVCYTGSGAGGQSIANNLNSYYGLILIKRRDATSNWFCWHRGTSTVSGEDAYNNFSLNSTSAASLGPTYMGTSFNVAYVTDSAGNVPDDSGAKYVAYLFGASVAGVSMTGLYTGTGALQTVNCGFTGGARFVLIKRVDSTGDWWTYDSARGITSGNDPYLFLNSTAAEVTSTNYIDTDSTGFKVTAAAPAGLNASGGKYIYLAIA